MVSLLSNLVAHEVRTFGELSGFTNPRPHLPSKEAFRAWSVNPDTQGGFISMMEGTASNLRVNKQTNPIRKMHGLIVDFDADFEGDRLAQIEKVAPKHLKPSWVYETFSGYTRLIYEFEKPVLWYGAEFMGRFCAQLKKALKLTSLFPGLDSTVFNNPHEYYEIGQNWAKVSEQKLSDAFLLDQVAKASQKQKWSEYGPEIPIKVIRPILEKRYPGAWPNGWSGFDLGARGTRFWEPGADALSAIVYPTGIFCFTGDKPFVPWSDLLGSDFVSEFTSTQIGKAVEGIYFDEKFYWFEEQPKEWTKFPAVEIERLLRTERDIAPKREGNSSEIDLAMRHIQRFGKIDVAFPLLYSKPGVHSVNSKKVLNISRVRPLPFLTSDRPVQWGEGFPRLSKYLSDFFGKQLTHAMAWLKHVYQSAHEDRLERGLGLILAGPTDAGKNFFGGAIVGQLLGGKADASRFLVGGDQFNENLFPFPLWTLNDAVSPDGHRAHVRFSQSLKMVVANDQLVYRPMYRPGHDLTWKGRVIITLNDDPESLQMLPQTDMNILDKIMLLKVSRSEGMDFPDDAEILPELTALGAYLISWNVSEEYLDQRFGVKPWHHPELLEAAHSLSRSAGFEELLQLWAREAEKLHHQWSGTPTDLLSRLYEEDRFRGMLREFDTAQKVGIQLNKLAQSKAKWLERKRTSGGRFYTMNLTQLRKTEQ